MSKWKLFNRSNNKTEPCVETIELTTEEDNEVTHIEIEEGDCEENTTDDSDSPLVEYDETLQSSKKTKKIIDRDDKRSEGYIDNDTPSEQRFWRNIKQIEENIDKLHISKAQKPKTNLEKTVDNIIDKTKK